MTSRLPTLRPLALALGLCALAPSARALDFVIADVGTTPMSAQQFAALQDATRYWQSRLSDDVTVYLNVSFADLGANELASTFTDKTVVDYGTLRGLLAADARSATDASALSHLHAGAALSFIATQPDLTNRLDNDGSTNNSMLYLTTANARALGVGTVNQPGSPDASIRFANSFAGSFAYTRTGGAVPAGQIDFMTVAEHEIGHALGFISGVDAIDFCVDHSVQCGTGGGFESSPWYYALDLFRYTAAGVLNLAVGGAPYFSVDGGATHLQPFSTGTAHGDGSQASHFGGTALTLMRPFVASGQSYDASPSDLTALDAIGWNLAAAAVPEPQSWLLLAGGLPALGARGTRRRAQ